MSMEQLLAGLVLAGLGIWSLKYKRPMAIPCLIASLAFSYVPWRIFFFLMFVVLLVGIGIIHHLQNENDQIEVLISIPKFIKFIFWVMIVTSSFQILHPLFAFPPSNF